MEILFAQLNEQFMRLKLPLQDKYSLAILCKRCAATESCVVFTGNLETLETKLHNLSDTVSSTMLRLHLLDKLKNNKKSN
ncbi:hypothetical protein T10_4874 [Trichinella papuae]|uniref:Uncharacterized protein n=1 Tax=Trichinella papuae TaxID=268474 RepID=A0A0V1MPD0_9BILA|nr:hypothetical protein T10_4874 [Trichinella papuae]